MNFERFKLTLVSCFLLTLVGCASVNYDDQADTELTNITQEVNQQFITWEDQAKSKPVAYDAKYYDKLVAYIKTVEIRMEASQDPATQNLIIIIIVKIVSLLATLNLIAIVKIAIIKIVSLLIILNLIIYLKIINSSLVVIKKALNIFLLSAFALIYVSKPKERTLI